jgi:hypothetical protein
MCLLCLLHSTSGVNRGPSRVCSMKELHERTRVPDVPPYGCSCCCVAGCAFPTSQLSRSG